MTKPRHLVDRGKGFRVRASHGVALLPQETVDANQAMQIADQRLYSNKGARRRSAVGQQTRDVLLQVLHERQPDLHDHLEDVGYNRIPVIQKATKFDIPTIQAAIEALRHHLDPKPGLKYAEAGTQYIVPDIVVDCHAEGDGWSELKLVSGMLAAEGHALPRRLGLPSGAGIIVGPTGETEWLGAKPFAL